MHIDLFSTRTKLAADSKQSDVYSYDRMPPSLRVQLIHIFRACLGRASRRDEYHQREELPAFAIWQRACDILRKEFGVHKLADSREPDDEILNFFERTESTDQALDVVELLCRFTAGLPKVLEKYQRDRSAITQDSIEAIDEINLRFRRAGFGYRFENPNIMRIDSDVLHENIVLPTIKLLSNRSFRGADEEFREAHHHYRLGENKQSLTCALKALESTMKVIHGIKAYPLNDKWTSKQLLDSLHSNGFFSDEVFGQLGALRATLEQGVPALRNRLGGHGQGETIKTVSDDLTLYCLNLTGSSITLLAAMVQRTGSER